MPDRISPDQIQIPDSDLLPTEGDIQETMADIILHGKITLQHRRLLPQLEETIATSPFAGQTQGQFLAMDSNIQKILDERVAAAKKTIEKPGIHQIVTTLAESEVYQDYMTADYLWRLATLIDIKEVTEKELWVVVKDHQQALKECGLKGPYDLHWYFEAKEGSKTELQLSVVVLDENITLIQAKKDVDRLQAYLDQKVAEEVIIQE